MHTSHQSKRDLVKPQPGNITRRHLLGCLPRVKDIGSDSSDITARRTDHKREIIKLRFQVFPIGEHNRPTERIRVYELHETRNRPSPKVQMKHAQPAIRAGC